MTDRLSSTELREGVTLEDIATILHRNRLQWYCHMLRKDDSEWVKRCMDYEVESVIPRGFNDGLKC